MVVQWPALLPHSKRVLGLNRPADSCSPHAWVFSLIGDSKLPIGLSLYVGPVTDWQPVPGVSRRSQVGPAPAPLRPC